MTLTYKRSKSTISPPLIDTTSSKKVVYIRKDVVERQRTDELTGETYRYYEYDEAKVPKAEYERYQREMESREVRQVRADTDYIALMTGVDLYEMEVPDEQDI